jgi:hypothetical protein
MKTIEVTDEVYSKLIELANEMTTQDPRGTRMPHMFQIRDWKKVYDQNCNGDTRFWLDRSSDPIEIETLEEFLDYLESMDIQHDKDEITSMWNLRETMYDTDLEEWIQEHCPDLEEWSYSMEAEYKNCFLTAKAAQEHLDRNYYHYHKNADVYLNHAWRNPEAELVSEFLCGLVGKKLHT